MLRYIIGISIISIVIMIIRRLSNGKILKKHQYALWIMVPVCMILFPFLKIGVTVPEALSSIIPVKETTDTAIISNSESNITPALEDQADTVDLSYDREAVDGVVYTDGSVLDGMTVSDYVVTEDVAAVESVDLMAKIEMYIINISIILVILLAIYNAGFVWYCRKNSKFIGRDPVSGLKIFGIDHKGTPFLLFNRIYVDYSADKMAKYKADNELYIDDATDRINKYVICHEACHYRHGDFAWVIVRHLVLIINWYNPLIWAAFILSGRDCELACDEAVIGVFGDESSIDYAETLLVMMQQRSSRSYRLTMSTGMGSGYEVMKKRIVSLKNPAKKSYKVLAMSLAALVMISGFSVLEPVAAESDSSVETEIAEVLALTDSNTVTAPEMREAPFDYAVSMPDVAQVSATEKNITFYRDGNAIESKLYLPEGEGPFETIVIRGDYCTSASNYTDVARYFANNGYAALIIGINYDEEIEARTYTGNVKNHVGDLVFEQLLDIYAVIDELRYLPDVDLDRLVLFGDETGGMFMAFVACEREEEFKGMVLFAPYLDNGQYVEFCDDPKYVGRIYEDLPECYLPTLFMHYESGILGETLKGCNIMPNSEFVYIENGTSWYDGNVGVEVAEAALPAIKSWG